MEATTGIIALVPDRWAGIVMPRHKVLRRLARDYPVVWIEPACNWRDHLVSGGRSFLAVDRWHSPEPGLDVLTPGSRHPGFHRPRWLRLAALRSRLAVTRRPLSHWLGSKLAGDLPRYIQHFDLCLMCYEVDDSTNYIYPLKLNEHLASGVPTVSSCIHAIADLPDVVTVAWSDVERLAATDDCGSDDAMARGRGASAVRPTRARRRA